jgi:hypothetical protein
MTAHDVTFKGMWAVIDRPYKGTTDRGYSEKSSGTYATGGLR